MSEASAPCSQCGQVKPLSELRSMYWRKGRRLPRAYGFQGTPYCLKCVDNLPPSEPRPPISILLSALQAGIRALEEAPLLNTWPKTEKERKLILHRMNHALLLWSRFYCRARRRPR